MKKLSLIFMGLFGCSEFVSTFYEMTAIEEEMIDIGLSLNDQSNHQTPPCGIDCPDMEMILIQKGNFKMGSHRSSVEQPIHQVQISDDFYVGKTEVTVGEYRTCVNLGPCTEPNSNLSDLYCNWTIAVGSKEMHPVNCVDWNQARTFAKWVGGDLLTEAQWEYVATAQGQLTTYPWGDLEPTCQLANYASCVEGTAEVCSTIEGNSRQGVCDMIGNVWEWVLDEWYGSYQGAPENGQAWCNDIGTCNRNTLINRVLRGAGIGNPSSDLSSTLRSSNLPSVRYTNVGFRVSSVLR